MVFGLEKLFRRGGPEIDSSEGDDVELQNPLEGKPEWRTTPEPEAALGKDQQGAVDTATLLARDVINTIKSDEDIRKRSGKKMSIYDAGRIKAYAAFVTVLEHGEPMQKVEAAIRVLHDHGTELQEKHARALERLKKIDKDQGEREATPTVATVVNTIGEEIQQLEAGITDVKKAIQTLAGRT